MVIPLIVVLAGGVLVKYDFNIGYVDHGLRHTIDLLNDSIGILLILIGVTMLAAMKTYDAFGNTMAALGAVAFAFLAGSLLRQFLPSLQSTIGPWMLLVQVLALASTVAFCLVVRHACIHYGAPSVGPWWLGTALAFIASPFLGQAVLMIVSSPSSENPAVRVVSADHWLLRGFFWLELIPYLLFLWSTTRMSSMARRAPLPAPASTS